METATTEVKMNKSYTILISLIVALGGFLLGFDSAVISGAVKGITLYFEMTEWMLGFSVGCVVFGAMAGNIVAGPLADRFGRKKVLIAILLYVAAFAISLGPVMWTLISEVFPSKIKGLAISVVGFFNSLVSFSVTQVFPWELSNLGPTVTFAIYALLSFCAILFVYKYIIETKGKTLEEVEKLLIR